MLCELNLGYVIQGGVCLVACPVLGALQLHYEYTVDGTTRRRYSVAHVVRPRTNTTNACLCFTLMSKLPEHKPWKRAAGEKDPSRSIILDLQEECDWKMPATVMMHTNEIQLSLDVHTE